MPRIGTARVYRTELRYTVSEQMPVLFGVCCVATSKSTKGHTATGCGARK